MPKDSNHLDLLDFSVPFTLDGCPVRVNEETQQGTVGHFWKWYGSNLLSHTLRGGFAEYIVGLALGIDMHYARYNWNPADVFYEYPTEEPVDSPKHYIRIECKTSGFLESPNQRKLNQPVFSIAPSFDCDKGKLCEPKARWSDLYVFCLFTEKDCTKANALDLNQWEFYVLPTYKLNDNKLFWAMDKGKFLYDENGKHIYAESENQQRISLIRIQRYAERGEITKATFSTLKAAIDSACAEIVPNHRFKTPEEIRAEQKTAEQ